MRTSSREFAWSATAAVAQPCPLPVPMAWHTSVLLMGSCVGWKAVTKASVSKSWRPLAVPQAFSAGATSIGPLVRLPPNAAPDAAQAAALFPAFLLGAESRRRPSHSRRTEAGSNPARALATTNTRRRRWASPKYWASRTRQATVRWGPATTPALVHPVAANGSMAVSQPASAERKQPKALSAVLRTPGTFSQKTMAGSSPRADRTWSIAFAISQKVRDRLPRASSRDFRNPATENAWHGVPPQNRSGASTSPARIISGRRVISPRFGTLA